MEPPGALPPDRDKYSTTIIQQQHQPNNSNLSSSSSALQVSASIGSVSSASAQQQPIERLSRPAAFDKMEILVREMQDSETGVPVRSQKLFLTSIPSAFMGYDLIEWLMERLAIEESEALNIANQLCLHGYFFPVNDCKTLVVKDDSSLYRFQTPYYWPWQHKAPDNVEYAIYLAKRSLRNKQRHGLEDYESDALASLHKNLKGKWDFITMQAEEQVKLSKDRKKGDKIVGDSQERAYWRVHRPPPGQFTPLEPCPVPSRDRQGKPRRRTVEDWQREVDYHTSSLGRTRMKMSQACECLVQYWDTFTDYDFFIQPVLPSNPWVSEDTTFWQLNNTIVEIPTEKRVKRWAITIEELVSDPTGLQEFTTYLKKEYSHENIRFWIAVNDLRRSAHSQIPRKVKEIYEEFLEPGAPCEINIDGKTMEKVQIGLKSPTRFTFDAAAEHIYTLLLKKDCYPRFIRSEQYKMLVATGIQPSLKKRFFGFGGVAKKKTSTSAAPNVVLLAQTQSNSSGPPPGHLTRRRGSDRSLTGSAHELAVSGVKDSTSKVPHSHSQSNLSDIPYSAAIYRGDMPSSGGCTILPTTMEVPYATDAPNNAADDSQNQEGTTKSLSENVEVTVEPGACAVCPWDTAEPIEPTVSLSVCPWDNEPSSTITAPKQMPRARNNSTIESGSSSSDISEVSERMRRSCGIRQNTMDCELFSSKRLTPAVPEQRRASMTMAPRIMEMSLTNPLQAAFHKSDTEIRPFQMLLPKTASFDEREDAAASIPLTISEECMDERHEIEATVTIERVPQDSTKLKESHESLVSNKSKADVQSIHLSLASESPTLKESTSITTFSTTPTINVVCPMGEEDINVDQEETSFDRMHRELSGEDLDKDKLSLDMGKGDSDSIIPQEELSPTTEEYQECVQTEDYELDIGCVGRDILAPGCVAPAPTPAPSVAPLAEIEADPPDDDVEMELSDQQEAAEAKSISSDQKKKRKKRDSLPKDKKSDKEGAVVSAKTPDQPNRNAVCPWEDEDVPSDATFVKTYATLGYL